MYMPMQKEPVQRTLAGQPCVNQRSGGAANGADACGQGYRAGEYGVQPSGGIDWGSIINTALPIISSFL